MGKNLQILLPFFADFGIYAIFSPAFTRGRHVGYIRQGGHHGVLPCRIYFVLY